MSIMKISMLAVTICLALFLSYKYVTSDPPGYCRAQARYILDEEFIKTSMTLLDNEKRQYRSKWATNPELYKHYISYDKIFEQNRKRPGFIYIGRNSKLTIFELLFGYQEIVVILNANSGDELINFIYDNCGMLKDSDIGLPASNMEPITTTTIRGKQ